jgi:radical SAM superfamily enzyme YgiQ (UPF0313 family)
MSKIAFVQWELKARFGTMYISSVLKKHGHDCDVFIKVNEPDIVQAVVDYKPDVIAFSTMTAGNKHTLEWAKEFRGKIDAFIIMGGPHPTFFPEVLEHSDCLDAICIGEGEYPMLELCNALDKKKDITKIKNLWVKKNNKIYKNSIRNLVDVDELPMCDRKIYYNKYHELQNVDTKRFFLVRGCPFGCTYCFNNAYKKICKGKGSYVRPVSVDKAISEMKYVKENYGMKWAQFITDTMNADRKWFMEFLDRYKKEINVPFLCCVRLDLVNEEMVKEMKEAGCERVDYAIESGDEWIRKNILKRPMSNETILQSGGWLRDYGFRVQTANLIGVPHETIETALKTVKMNQILKPEIAKCAILQPYPRTEINEYAKKHGMLPLDYYSESGTGFQTSFDATKQTVPIKVENPRELTNMCMFFDMLSKYPILEPIIMRLVKIRTNRFFKLAYIYPFVRLEMKFANTWARKIKNFNILLKTIFAGM